MTMTPETLEAFAYAYHDWQDWIVNGYGNDYDQVFNEKQAMYERLRGELLAAATPPAAAPAPAVPTWIYRRVYRDSSEHKAYLAARFARDSTTRLSFEWEGHRWAYCFSSFDDHGEYDLLQRCATPAAPAQEQWETSPKDGEQWETTPKPSIEPVTLTDEEVDKVIEGETGFIGLGTCALDKSALRKIVYESIAALREKEGRA